VSKRHQIFSACYLVAMVRSFSSGVAMLATSGFVDDVMFAVNGQEQTTQKWRILKVTHQMEARSDGREADCAMTAAVFLLASFIEPVNRKWPTFIS